jgi:thioredoxin-related protein
MKKSMKQFFVIVCLTLGSFALQAQEAKWETDFGKAARLSISQKKPLMLFFTGSDWCGWCTRLQKEVFFTPAFISWAEKNVVLVELDFPRHKQLEKNVQEQNNSLQQSFQVQGFPTIWLVNAMEKEGKMNLQQLGKTGYVAGGPDAWLANANQILNIK